MAGQCALTNPNITHTNLTEHFWCILKRHFRVATNQFQLWLFGWLLKRRTCIGWWLRLWNLHQNVRPIPANQM
jgi:hypothetical protein